MRFTVTSPAAAWGCALLLSWNTLACAQDALPDEAPKDNPLMVQPETVGEKFSAALLTLKLARPDLAKHYLEQILADSPSEDDLLAIREQHGTGVFLELSGIEALNPAATELLDRLNEAVRNHVGNPEYADALLDKLSGSARQRIEALNELRHLGPNAVPPIIHRIAQDQTDDVEILTLTLTRLGAPAIPPIIGALLSPDPEVRAVAARVLGVIGGQEDIVWLWGPAFDPNETPATQAAAREALALLKYRDASAVGRLTTDGIARQLTGLAGKYLSGKYRWPEMYDDEELIPIWTWDAEKNTVAEHPVLRPQAAIFNAERLAREASRLAPDDQLATVVLMASLLARDVELNGWQFPLPNTPSSAFDLAVTAGPDFTEQVLQYSLDQNIVSSALASLQVLSLNGSTRLLTMSAPHGAVLRALDSGDQRLQFAAAVTILHWDPTKPFRNSRRVIEILTRTLNSDQTPASVVIDPNMHRANETAGLFTGLGYPATLARTGMEGFQVAAEQGNIGLAVLHPNVVRWELTQTIANLRSDARTASIPVVIYGPKSIHPKYDDISSKFQNVAYIDEGNVPADIVDHLTPFLNSISPPPLTPEQRLEQIKEASFWLRRIAIRDVGHLFDLTPAVPALSRSLEKPELAEDALVTLGSIGTAEVQKTLLVTAIASSLDEATRSLATSQLAYHIQRFGVLLKPADLTALKETYSTESNPEIRAALAVVIGTLNPPASAARNLLLSRPMSPAPVEAPLAN